MAEQEFTPKQRAFIREYPIDWNATQAAIRAGYAEKSAHSIAYKLLQKVKIRAAIDEIEAKLTIGAHETLARLSQHARAAYAPYLTPSGVDLEGLLRDGLGHLVKGLKYSPKGEIIVEFHDSQAALVHMGKHHKLFTESIDLTAEHSIKGYGKVNPDDWDESEDG